jgi:pimeloyl-ACP methyl ester carboxylesterase
MPVCEGFYYYHHEGGDPDKPPVLFLHGLGGSNLDWPPDLRRLAGARVFVPDLPGHGRSQGIGWQSIPDYVKSIISFMDAVQLRRALIVGHSMGGAIALQMALQHKGRVAGLGLISTGARLPIPSSVLTNAANPATMALAIETMLGYFFGPDTTSAIRTAVAQGLSATRPAVLNGDLLACDGYDATKLLRRVRVPVLVICGTEDRLTPQQYSQALAGKIPGAALQTLDRGSHMVLLEQPRRIAGLLSVFLATIPYRPGEK